jgi:hypothetical protein
MYFVNFFRYKHLVLDNEIYFSLKEIGLRESEGRLSIKEG